MRTPLALLILIASSVFAQTTAQLDGTIIPSAGEPCPDWNQFLARLADSRAEAAQVLSAVIDGKGGFDGPCAGFAMSDLAAALSISGRLPEAERVAERAIRSLEETRAPDDPALLRPLHTLAAVRLDLGKTAQARHAFRRMQSIRVPRPEDRGLVISMAASLLDAEGKWPEAESQYLAAIESLRDAGGHGDTADTAALLNALANVYIKERRLTDADRALNQSLAIFERVPDTDPWDRIKLLHTRSALRARQNAWQEAERDLASALSIADRESRTLPGIRSLLSDYAAVLRRNRRTREARLIEKRLSALGRTPGANAVVDVSDLLANRR